MGGTRRRPAAAVTAAAVWLALPGLTSTQRTPQSVVQLNLDENGKEVPYILTPLHVRRERREWRPPKAHNEYVMFDHEKKQCDELPAIHPCFTYEVRDSQPCRRSHASRTPRPGRAEVDHSPRAEDVALDLLLPALAQNEMGQDSFLVSSVDVGYHSTYDQNWQCGKTLLAPAGYTLQLDWVEFDLYLGDTVKVWDGCSNVKGERLLLTEATGAKNPTTVVSEMECLYIEFTTNERWQRGGFNASVTCNPPMYGGELGPAGPGYFEQECFQYWDNTGLARVDCMNFMHPGVQCHALRDIEHGVAVMSNERWYPSVAHYECEGGYEVCDGENNTAQNCVVGDNHRICMPSKIYNGTTPTCVGIICEEADKPEGARIRYRKASNGAPSVDPARQYPCFVEYACSPGYILNDDCKDRKPNYSPPPIYLAFCVACL
eukprot:COSAG06_NODE_3373_length_5435_cov_1.793478_3_plen_432_part_00